jgi:signal transduction histidine kinase
MLAQEGARIVLRVVDNGVGFVPPGRGGLGLSGMRERIEAVAGRFRISSRAGVGTILQAIVYLKEKPLP